MSQAPVLEVNGLVKHFPVARGVLRRKLIGMVRAVENVSFEIARGETLAWRPRRCPSISCSLAVPAT